MNLPPWDPFIPNTEYTVRLSTKRKFTKPGQRNPYEPKPELNQRGSEFLGDLAAQQQAAMAGGPGTLSGFAQMNPHLNGQAQQQVPMDIREMLGLRW